MQSADVHWSQSLRCLSWSWRMTAPVMVSLKRQAQERRGWDMPHIDYLRSVVVINSGASAMILARLSSTYSALSSMPT